MNLPSTLFETAGVELETGLLNQAAPKNGTVHFMQYRLIVIV